MSQTSTTRNDAELNWREKEGTENSGQYKIRLNKSYTYKSHVNIGGKRNYCDLLKKKFKKNIKNFMIILYENYTKKKAKKRK